MRFSLRGGLTKLVGPTDPYTEGVDVVSHRGVPQILQRSMGCPTDPWGVIMNTYCKTDREDISIFCVGRSKGRLCCMTHVQNYHVSVLLNRASEPSSILYPTRNGLKKTAV